MLVHWHTEEGEGSLLWTWLRACLAEIYRPEGPDQAVHSWGDPSGPIHYGTMGREGVLRADSWTALARQLRADRSVAACVDREARGTFKVKSGSGYPSRPGAHWSWVDIESSGPVDADATPTQVLYPVFAPPDGVGPPLHPRSVALILDPGNPASWDAAAGLQDSLLRALPEVSVELVLPRPTQPSTGAQVGRNSPGCRTFRSLQLGDCGTVVFFGTEIEMAPLVLEAMAAGRRVAAPAHSIYAGYLADKRGLLWNPEQGVSELTRLLIEELTQDWLRDVSTRRTSAWARRWTVARTAAGVEQLMKRAWMGRSTQARSQPARWVIRREVCIGDVHFALCAAAGLKQAYPECEVWFHTAPDHAPWVRWFQFVDRVTSGEFEPPPGARILDLEESFPNWSKIDRATTMGDQIGVPVQWLPPPHVPIARRREARRLLPRAKRLRIGYAPASSGRSATRSLPARVALELARECAEFGEVVWMDAIPNAAPPGPGITDLSGKLTPAQALAVMTECDLCVSVDSGLLYMAAALGKPIVGLFTHIAALQRLWLVPRFVALQPSLPCAPCGEGDNAFHCRLGATRDRNWLYPCVTLPWERHLRAALVHLQSPGAAARVVWSIDPAGERTVWEIDTLPVPWPRETPMPVDSKDGDGHPQEMWLPPRQRLQLPTFTRETLGV